MLLQYSCVSLMICSISNPMPWHALIALDIYGASDISTVRDCTFPILSMLVL